MKVFVAIVVILVSATGIQTARLYSAQKTIAELESEKSDLVLTIETANAKAAEIEKSLTQKVLEAQNAAKSRGNIRSAAASAAAAEFVGLRGDLKAFANTADLSTNAHIERTSTIGQLLESCTSEYLSLAGKADKHTNDLQTMIEAWPSVNPDATASKD